MLLTDPQGQAAPKICAIIVTRNRPALLVRSIKAVYAQTAPCQLLVIDNQSTDRTPRILSDLAIENPLRLKIITLSENTGGAGGFHLGLRQAFTDGFDLFWLMDDDCIAAPTALAQLLFARDGLHAAPPAFFCSKVLWRDGSLCNMNIPRPYQRARLPQNPRQSVLDNLIQVRDATFVSLLLDRAALATYGLPFAQYFIWFDDTDFTRRLSRRAPGILCLDSIVHHETPTNGIFALENATPADIWKYEYGLRNETSHIGATLGMAACLAFVGATLAALATNRLRLPLKTKLMRSLWRGIFFRPKIEFPIRKPELSA